MKKKYVKLILCGLVVLTMLASCSTNTLSPKERNQQNLQARMDAKKKL